MRSLIDTIINYIGIASICYMNHPLVSSPNRNLNSLHLPGFSTFTGQVPFLLMHCVLSTRFPVPRCCFQLHEFTCLTFTSIFHSTADFRLGESYLSLSILRYSYLIIVLFVFSTPTDVGVLYYA